MTKVGIIVIVKVVGLGVIVVDRGMMTVVVKGGDNGGHL